MSIPTSESRFTSEGTPMVNPSCASTPFATAKDAQGFSKAGRRVLAELACNDSPVIGLLPPGTPASSCKQKSSSGGPVRSRRALLSSNLPSHPASSTPLGESLLRSQVQLLLQKVESDMCAPPPCLGGSMHPSVRSGFMASPTMLAAPTPLNTPAAMAPPVMQDSGSICEVVVKSASLDESCALTDGSCLESICTNGVTVGFFDAHTSSAEEPAMQNRLPVEEGQGTISTSGGFTTYVSTTTCLDMKPLQTTPMLVEVLDVPSPSEIFPGKRVLHFDDDTPCKPSPTKQFDTTSFDESGSHSLVRELDDDEVSEWSVHVNVGSPTAEKQNVIEQAENCVLSENGNLLEGFSSSIHEHVKKIQQKSSNKVDLLWHKGRGRKVGPFKREEDEHYEEQEEQEDVSAEYEEQYYSGDEEEEMAYGEDAGECDNLCDMFKEMRFEETESKGLPRGEGKHIRFLYGEDEDEDGIVETMVIKGEEEVMSGCTATRLNGLPAPLGRHWRFVQEDEEEEEDGTRSR